jgi:hypothetical protein
MNKFIEICNQAVPGTVAAFSERTQHDATREEGFMSYDTPALYRTTILPPPPLIDPAGCAPDPSDERLNAVFVRRCVEMVLDAAGLRPSFFLVAPTASPNGRSACTLFADLPRTSPAMARLLARSIDGQLRNDEGYATLRASGEYETLRIFAIDRDRCEPGAEFAAEMLRRGRCPGSLYDTAFDSFSDWESIFPGHFVV